MVKGQGEVPGAFPVRAGTTDGPLAAMPHLWAGLSRSPEPAARISDPSPSYFSSPHHRAGEHSVRDRPQLTGERMRPARRPHFSPTPVPARRGSTLILVRLAESFSARRRQPIRGLRQRGGRATRHGGRNSSGFARQVARMGDRCGWAGLL